jgi:hypothetical protein
MRCVVLVLALALILPATAAAQDPPPSLTVDTVFSLPGVDTLDFRADLAVDDAHGAAVDPELGRFYAVGRTETLGGDTDIAIVARRPDGSLDPSFGDGGRLAVPVTLGRDDYAVSLSVLPDHRLRVLGATDVSIAARHDVALVGLLADGTSDPDFGVAGIARFSVGGDDAPADLAVGPDGRLAITGSATGPAGGESAFVAVRAANGGPSGLGAQSVDLGAPGEEDRGVSIAWGPDGPIALVAIDGAQGDEASVLSINENDPLLGTSSTGVGGQELGFGGSVRPSALLVRDGTLWATGSVVANNDSDAWLARLAPNGTVLEARRFDIRGTAFASSQPVNTKALTLTLVAGDPDTLVVGGSTATDRGEDWSFAAFNALDGPVSALRSAELVVPVDGVGAAESIAAGPGAVSAAGTLTDFDPALGGTGDLTIGMGRVLVDAEKRCDLALALVRPLELVLRGKAPSPLTFRITNTGQRACDGTIRLPAPYAMLEDLAATGRLGAGQSITRTVNIAYKALFPPTDTLAVTLDAPNDAQLSDNTVRIRVTFSFCDLELKVATAPTVLGNEGGRRHRFALRNVGTAPCKAATVLAGLPGRRLGAVATYPVAPGRRVTDIFDVGVVRGTRSGRRVALQFMVRDADDVRDDNNNTGSDPRIVRPGDTNARKPSGGRVFRGSSRPGSGRGVPKRTLRVKSVEIAVLRSGKGCRWLSSLRGDLRVVDAGPKGRCDEPVWIVASGTKKWRLALRHKLPAGRYTLFSRAVLANGVAEARFTRADHTRVTFRVR